MIRKVSVTWFITKSIKINLVFVILKTCADNFLLSSSPFLLNNFALSMPLMDIFFHVTHYILHKMQFNLSSNQIMSISPTNRGRIYFSEPAKVFQGSNRPWTKFREAWMIEHKISLTTDSWELGIKIILKTHIVILMS